MALANETYDVFVSYSRADWRRATDIDSALRTKGLKPFFDRRNLPPGLPWVRALEQAIGAAKAAILLIGPHGFGNSQQYERELAVFRQSRDPTFRVVPVPLPDTRYPPFTFLHAFHTRRFTISSRWRTGARTRLKMSPAYVPRIIGKFIWANARQNSRRSY